jgi:hypothetical protein
MLESAAMESIKEFIEFLVEDIAEIGANLFPFAALGLLGLYVLWLVIGYLRVSQVGLGDGRAAQPVRFLPSASTTVGTDPGTETATDSRPRGVPYCAFDGLQYPHGARFCTTCERDLLLDCTNCGATLAAGDASCYRCGTRTAAVETNLLG